MDIEEYKKKYLGGDFTRFPFTSKRKRMSTILNVNSTETGHSKRVHLKGAAEIVLDSCKYYLDENGRKLELGDEMSSKLK